MLLCKVASGKEFKTTANMDGRDGRNSVMPPPGHDSVHGQATEGGVLNYDELVVYEEAAVLPFAIVGYGFLKV